jgi:xanthine dehydrogenase accessory factor
MQLATLEALNEARSARRAAVLVTGLDDGSERLVTGAPQDDDPLASELALQMRQGKSALVEREGRRYFLTVHVPPVKLVMTGAVHISQALIPMAQLVGFEPVVIDPRTAFATPERFPDANLIAEWPDVALPPLGVDRYTAFVALTHDPKIDDPALEHALARDCFYIGALGSRKTHAKRVERLRAAGFAEAAIGRIRAPIGLDIGAVSPAEIAVSIIAEITAALRLESGERKARAA